MRPSYFGAVARRGLLFRGSSVRPVFAVLGRSMDSRHCCPPVAGVKAGESFPDRRLRGRLASPGLCPRRLRRAGGAGIRLRPSTRRTNLSAYALDDSLAGRLAGFSICGGVPGLCRFCPWFPAARLIYSFSAFWPRFPGGTEGAPRGAGFFQAAWRRFGLCGMAAGPAGVPVMLRWSGAALHRKSRRSVKLRRLAAGDKD